MTGLWFLHFAIPFIVFYHCIKFHLFSFNTFRDMLQTSLLLQKLEKEITLKLLVTELRFLHCTSPDGRLSMYHFFFQYAPDKLFIMQKINKGSNSVNTGDRVLVLAFCNSPHGPLSVYQVSLNYLQYF